VAAREKRMPRHLIQTAASTILLATLALAGCASRPAQPAETRFILVRHAEKADDGSKDPPLSAVGEARAQRLAALLRDTPVRGVYATAYRRTQATAAATAREHDLPVTTYDAALAASDFAARLRRDHGSGTVLVVGHSNTIPAIAAALCQCQIEPIAETEFDRRITIRIDAQGRASTVQERY
jgi:broad specificity phosphatase PhoE